MIDCSRVDVCVLGRCEGVGAVVGSCCCGQLQAVVKAGAEGPHQ